MPNTISLPDFNLNITTLNKFTTDFESKISNVSARWKDGYIPTTEGEIIEMKTDYKIIQEEKKAVELRVAEFLQELISYEKELKTTVAYWKNLSKVNVLDKLTSLELTLKQNINKAREIIEQKEAQRIALAKKAIEDENLAKIAKAKELLDSLGMDSTGVEEQITVISANQVAQLATPVSKSVYTSAGIVTERTSYKIDKIDKIAIMKWVLDHPDHIALIDINQVYANQIFKPTQAKKEPMLVDGLVFKKVTTV